MLGQLYNSKVMYKLGLFSSCLIEDDSQRYSGSRKGVGPHGTKRVGQMGTQKNVW